MLLTAAKVVGKIFYKVFKFMGTTKGMVAMEGAAAGVGLATAPEGETVGETLKSIFMPLPIEIFNLLVEKAPAVRRQRFLMAVPQLVNQFNQTVARYDRIGVSKGGELELLDLALVEKTTPQGTVVPVPTALITYGDVCYCFVLGSGKYRAKLGIMNCFTEKWLNRSQLPQPMQRFVYQLCEMSIAVMPKV